MRFLFVDQVLELERNQRIVATRQVSLADEIFAEHFPGRPMMPASLLIESLAQAATILLETSREFQCKAYVGFVNNAKFHKPVVPGSEIRLELTTEHLGDDGALLRGIVSQNEQRCVKAEIGMVTAPVGEFFTQETLHFYHGLYIVWLAATRFYGFAGDPREALNRVQI